MTHCTIVSFVCLCFLIYNFYSILKAKCATHSSVSNSITVVVTLLCSSSSGTDSAASPGRVTRFSGLCNRASVCLIGQCPREHRQCPFTTPPTTAGLQTLWRGDQVWPDAGEPKQNTLKVHLCEISWGVSLVRCIKWCQEEWVLLWCVLRWVCVIYGVCAGRWVKGWPSYTTLWRSSIATFARRTLCWTTEAHGSSLALTSVLPTSLLLTSRWGWLLHILFVSQYTGLHGTQGTKIIVSS